jgi:response regulator RpfG family c-di-GMP phosphodiesterase
MMVPGSFFQRWRPERARPGDGAADDPAAEREAMEETSLRLSSALVIAFDARDPGLDIVGHSSRVARLAEDLARGMGLSERDVEVLARAAQLHEIGMISVPQELLERPSQLSPEELARVRFQAVVGAEIVRAAYDDRTAVLIERQYLDYAWLARTTQLAPTELLLSGILRVADVLDAVSRPRPYQDPMPAERQREVLRSGMGSRFHPLVVHSGLHMLHN